MQNTETVIPSTEFSLTFVHGSVKSAMREAAAQSRELWQVPLEFIRIIPEFNVRIRDERYHAHLRTITDSIKTEGFYQHKPLEGYVSNEGGNNIIYLTGGHTRFEATKIANAEGCEIHTLPIVISPPGTSQEDLIVALVKGNEGKPLTPFETAIVCKRLVNFGWSTATVAKRLGLTSVYVDGLLLLVGAPIAIRDMVQSGQLAATTAIQTLRTEGGDAVNALAAGAQRAKESGASRVTAKHLPGHALKKKVRKSAETIFATLKLVSSDPAYLSLSESVRAQLDKLILDLVDKDGTPPPESSSEPETQQIDWVDRLPLDTHGQCSLL